jgi:PAS domain S-box-containing protein
MGDRQRILVVDDELGPREALRMILKSRFEVMTASCGSEALALLQQTSPDLVFLDIKMREMSGIEVLKAIRQIDTHIEVVMMTAYASLETAREAVALHASDYLIKPFSKAEVEQAVNKALAHRVERTGSRQAIRKLLEQMRALTEPTETGTSLVQSTTLLLEQGAQALQATAALLYTVDATGQTLTSTVLLHVPTHLHDALAQASWLTLLQHSLSRQQPHCFSAATTDGHAQALMQVIRPLGYDAGVFFPLLAGTHALGGLVFLFTTDHIIPTNWQERGQTFAALIALTIRSHQRYHASLRDASQQAQRVAQLSILREMSRVILTRLDLADMLQAIGDQLLTGLGYAGFSVWLHESSAPDGQPVYSQGQQYGWHATGTTDAVPTALRVDNVDDMQVVIAPIEMEGQAIGVVELVRQAQHGPLVAFEIELIRMVLDYLGMAVKNSQLYGEMKETKSYLENLINDAGDAIITVNTTDTITSWNDTATRLLRCPPEVLLGRNMRDLVSPAEYEQWRSAVLQDGQVKHLETRLSQLDGTPVDVSMTLSPLRGSRDEIVGFSAIIKDITQDKQLRERLLQTEKLRALGEMAAGVAHNFNNILTTILGHTQLLLTYPSDTATMHEGLTIIEKATRDAAQVVQRIQTFARGNPVAECHLTDLVQVIKEAVETTRPVWKQQAEYQGRSIDMTLEFDPIPMVPCRAAELREVLTNLILNAVDAMPSGGSLSLHTYQQGGFACIAVSDTGVGMPEDMQPRIFDPFFTTKQGKGTGLGLSVSHTLIKGHGGDIEVQSTPGSGTTFVITLPVA